MIDFYRMRQLIRQCGKAWQEWQRALESAQPKSPILSDMPKTHSNESPVERAVIKADDLYQAYKESFDELQEMREELRPMIDRLTDSTDRAVMRLRYLDGYSPDIIADSTLFPMSRRGIYYHLYHGEECIRCWQSGQNG